MTMQWFTPRGLDQFVSRSSDGYYAVGKRPAEPDSVRQYEAFHIEAVWARPVAIGWGSDIAAAQQVCEQHRERQHAPA